MFQTVAQQANTLRSRQDVAVVSAQRVTQTKNAAPARKPRPSFAVVLLRALSAFTV